MHKPFLLTCSYLVQGMAIFCIAIFTVSCSQTEQPQSQSQTQADLNQLVSGGARLPGLTSLSNNEVLMSWLQPVGNNYALKFAQLKNGRIVHQGEITKGPNWFVNWADLAVQNSSQKMSDGWRVPNEKKWLFIWHLFAQVDIK